MSGASHMVTQEVAALAQNRSGLLAFARLAETAERDDDMIEAMTAVLRLSAAGSAITGTSAAVCWLHTTRTRARLVPPCVTPAAWTHQGAERVLFSAAFKAKCSKLRDAHRAATALVLRGESTHEVRCHACPQPTCSRIHHAPLSLCPGTQSPGHDSRAHAECLCSAAGYRARAPPGRQQTRGPCRTRVSDAQAAPARSDWYAWMSRPSAG